MASKSNLIKLFLLVVIVGLTLRFALRQSPSQPVSVGDTAPDFTLPTLGAGSLSLRDYRRQVVLVNFWATWCPPCIEETPGLEKFAEQMQNQGVTVIGVSVDQDAGALQRFVTQNRLSFPMARDPDRAVASRFGTFKFPETYILDRDGKVAEKVIGAADWQDPRLLTFVKELARSNARPSQ
jgi:cytochrome c biogenesis protein CcmG/thiol:disulfide interchange protein DsbE